MHEKNRPADGPSDPKDTHADGGETDQGKKNKSTENSSPSAQGANPNKGSNKG